MTAAIARKNARTAGVMALLVAGMLGLVLFVTSIAVRLTAVITSGGLD